MNAGLILHDVYAQHPHGPEVLLGVNLAAPRGEMTALLGPNGAGKSTLLKAIIGRLPFRGRIELDGRSVHEMAPRYRARHVAYVPQRSQLDMRMPVRSVVEQGRFTYRNAFGRMRPVDQAAVDQALKDSGAQDLGERFFTELSGGEQQRVLLARALATGATTLLLDEPTAALDVRQVLLFHRTLRKLVDQGYSVLIVLHDLNEAHRHADRAVLLNQGKVHDAGVITHIVAAQPIRAVYGVEVQPNAGLDLFLPEEHYS